jgi:predicted  nucleic acid-binding Zn-ribbon protein
MNKDIETMIRLQKYWSDMRAAESSIQKIADSIRSIENVANSARHEVEKSDAILKTKRTAIKNHENDLREREARIASLEKRKDVIRTEKELQAVEKEIDVLRLEAEHAEESALMLMEELDQAEKNHADLKALLVKEETRLDETKKKAESSISGHEEKVLLNRKSFDSLVAELSGKVRSKFEKLISSREGIGIARVEGEICGFCNFQIPAHLAIQAGDNSATVNCTNCGRYIYR